jgi:hypothetical protein
MDPQLKSVLTSFGMTGATALATWAATKGFITPDQQSALATGLVTLAGGLITAVVLEYKRRQVSPTSLIKAVNTADNGVKVVPETATATQVNAPLK